MSQFVKNLIPFKIGWGSCVFGAAYSQSWLGLVGVAVLLSLGWESTLASLNLLTYGDGTLIPGISPYPGANLGAVELSNNLMALVTIGVGWATLLPLMVKVTDHFDGHSMPQLEKA